MNIHHTDRPRPFRSRRALVVAGALSLALLATACGGDDGDGANDATDVIDGTGAPATEDTLFDQASLGVPEECIGVFPFAMEAPDADEIDLAPAGWPAPPEGATLCVTSEPIDGDSEVAEYAWDSTPDEVLDYYEAELGDAFQVEREAGVGQGLLSGYDDAVGFQILPLDGGAFRIAFGTL
jgi:hypothetical protein